MVAFAEGTRYNNANRWYRVKNFWVLIPLQRSLSRQVVPCRVLRIESTSAEERNVRLLARQVFDTTDTS